MLEPDQVTVASTSRCFDLTATNAALCNSGIRSQDAASKECTEGGEHVDTRAGVWKWYGNEGGIKGRIKAEQC